MAKKNNLEIEELRCKTQKELFAIIDWSYKYSKQTLNSLLSVCVKNGDDFYIEILKKIIDRTYRTNKEKRHYWADNGIDLLPSLGKKGISMLERLVNDSVSLIRWRAVCTIGKHHIFPLYHLLSKPISGEFDEAYSSAWALAGIDPKDEKLRHVGIQIILDFFKKIDVEKVYVRRKPCDTRSISYVIDRCLETLSFLDKGEIKELLILNNFTKIAKEYEDQRIENG